jgi:predicted naringenin-chalcone synthase
MPTVLDTIATATPPTRALQPDTAAFMQRITSLPERLRARLPAIYRGTAIDRRHSAIADFAEDDPDNFTFFPSTWSLKPAPSTAARNAKYREAILPLTRHAAREALAQSDTDAADITHVIGVSCTGFFAPGFDIHLVKELGLPPTTQRTFIGFMGCYAAFNALRVAHSFCESQPNARVLIVCAELCTLHFQVDGALETAVVNALFADGCAAAIVSQRDTVPTGALEYINSRTTMDDDSMDHMTWDIGDTGFQMGLSSRVPRVIAEHLPAYVEGLVPDNASVDFWAIHPGGRAIVDKAQEVLGLSDADVHDSLEVLRTYGNMSSPTILFILKRMLEHGPDTGTHGVSMAFGPGLTIEGALWKWGA